MNSTQIITSAKTALNQIPAIHRKYVPDLRDMLVLDYGAGKGLGTSFLRDEHGIDCKAYDPFNMPGSERVLEEGPFDVILVANVLNVLESDTLLMDVIHDIISRIVVGGHAIIGIHEGDRGGVGCVTPRGWQRNEKTAEYRKRIEGIQGVEVSMSKGSIIVTRVP